MSGETFQAACPHCGRQDAVPVAFLGKQARCKDCSRPFTVLRKDEGQPTTGSPSERAKAQAQAHADLEKKLVQGLKICGGVALLLLVLVLTGRKIGTNSSRSTRSTKLEAREPAKVRLPMGMTYVIHDERIMDSPLKTQILQEVSVAGKVDEANVRQLLAYLYDKALRRTGFKHHEHPTNIFVTVWASEAHYRGQNPALAALTKGHDDSRPTITFAPEVLRPPSSPATETRLGLSVQQRRGIWDEYLHAEDRARSESERLYPPRQGLRPKRESKRRELRLGYLARVAKGHGLTMDQLESIGDEGTRQNWPFPESKYKSSADW